MYLTLFIVNVLWYLKRQYSITFLLCYIHFMIEIFFCFSLFPFFFPRVLRLDKMLLLFREIFDSIYYATWENLKEIMNLI